MTKIEVKDEFEADRIAREVMLKTLWARHFGLRGDLCPIHKQLPNKKDKCMVIGCEFS